MEIGSGRKSVTFGNIDVQNTNNSSNKTNESDTEIFNKSNESVTSSINININDIPEMINKPPKLSTCSENLFERSSLSTSPSIRKSPYQFLPQIDDHKDYIPTGHEIKGFQRMNPHELCCVFPPRPSMMNSTGWVFWGLFLVICWPLSIIPCILPCSYDPYQVPIYDDIDKDFSYKTNKNLE